MCISRGAYTLKELKTHVKTKKKGEQLHINQKKGSEKKILTGSQMNFDKKKKKKKKKNHGLSIVMAAAAEAALA